MIGVFLGLMLMGQGRGNTPWLADKLEAIRTKHNVPSLAAALMIEGKEVAHAAVGVREFGKNDRVSLDDRYHFGSITKSLTGTLIGILVDQGKLRWDTTIGEIWKGDSVKPAYRTVTITQLLSHRSGISSETYFKDGADYFTDKRPIQEQRLEYALRALAEDPVNPPGTKLLYSNRGIIVAAAIAEKVMGESWESMVERLIFKPLNMETAGFGPVGSKEAPGGLGHVVADGKPVAVPLGISSDNAPVTHPAGGLHATVDDLLKYAAVHAGVKQSILGQKSLDFLHEPKGDDYACGWLVLHRGWVSGPLLYHNGSNTMNYADLWIAPSRKFALIIACNEGGDEAVKAVQEAGDAIVRETMIGK